MKLKIIIPILFLVMFVFGISLFIIFNNEKKGNEASTNIDTILSHYGVPKFIDGAFADIKINSQDDVLKALEQIKDLMQIKSVKEEFVVLDKNVSEEITYYKLQQIYNNVPIYGQQLIISVDKKGNIKSLSGEYIPNIVLDDNAKTIDEVTNKVKSLFEDDIQIINANKYIYSNGTNSYYIYIINIKSGNNAEIFVLDATTLEVISRENDIQSISYDYLGEGLLEKNKGHEIKLNQKKNLLGAAEYEFYDETRNIKIIDGKTGAISLGGATMPTPILGSVPITLDKDFKYKNNSSNNQALKKNATTAMAYFADIYDFYKNVLGRNSYDNKGSEITVYIDVPNWTLTDKEYKNANWFSLSKSMFIGNINGTPFTVAKDVLAHEFTHGVISTIVDFDSRIATIDHLKEKFSDTKIDYDRKIESAALNEAYPDIMGLLIEGKNFKMGDANSDIEKAVNRNHESPSVFEKPSKKEGDYYYPYGFESYKKNNSIEEFLKHNNLKSLDDWGNWKHHNATVVGHAAYLMYKSGAFKDKQQMAKVWYNSLFLLSSTADFESCALAVIKSAKNLRLSSDSINKIEHAFRDTNMLEETKFKLGGSVKDENNKSLENVKVTVTHKFNNTLTHTTYTNNMGLYNFEQLPRGEYIITFVKSEYDNKEEKIMLDKESLRIDIIMTKPKTNNSFLMPAWSFNEVVDYTIENIPSSLLGKVYVEGKISRGTIKVGEQIEMIIGGSRSSKYKVLYIIKVATGKGRISVTEAQAKDSVMIILDGITYDEAEDIRIKNTPVTLLKPGTIKTHSKFKVQLKFNNFYTNATIDNTKNKIASGKYEISLMAVDYISNNCPCRPFGYIDIKNEVKIGETIDIVVSLSEKIALEKNAKIQVNFVTRNNNSTSTYLHTSGTIIELLD